IFRICLLRSRRPSPQSSTPQLLDTTVRSLTPRRTSAAIRFSGMPQRPKPPTTIVAPSATSATASSAAPTTFCSIRTDDHRPRRAGAPAGSDGGAGDREELGDLEVRGGSRQGAQALEARASARGRRQERRGYLLDAIARGLEQVRQRAAREEANMGSREQRVR